MWSSLETAMRNRFADDVGQMHVQVAAARDVEDLHAAADRQRGRVPRSHAGSYQCELEGVALGTGRVDRVVIGLAAEARRLDVAAAAEHDAVERREQRAGSSSPGGNSTGCPPPARTASTYDAGTAKRGRSSPSRW